VTFQLPENSQIHLALEEASLSRLHEAIAGEQRTDVLVEALTGYISHHLKVDLSGAKVIEVLAPTGEISSEGTVRFFWPGHMRRVMLHLKEVTQTRAERMEL
jgi:hypothetical protein